MLTNINHYNTIIMQLNFSCIIGFRKEYTVSRKDKLLSRLLSRPKDFTYDELKALLMLFAYKEDNVGKTSGSAVCFINDKNHIIRLHKPHPDNIVKSYVVKMIIEELSKEGFIDE